MQIAPLDCPKRPPHGYVELDGEPAFDPARHLALERPTRHWTLEDFGYDAESIDAAPSPPAITVPFRLLSPEGAATLEEIALELRRFAQQAQAIKDFESNRNQTYLAGGVYRSRFLRELCHCREALAFCSELAGTPLAAHSLPSQQVYINYAPEQMTADVDVWHADSIGFDYLLLASDPATFEGGNFEFFVGTRNEAAGYLGLSPDRLNRGRAEGIPADRIRSIAFPSPGFAIFQQGNYVVHRARRLNRPAQRVSVVPGLVPCTRAATTRPTCRERHLRRAGHRRRDRAPRRLAGTGPVERLPERGGYQRRFRQPARPACQRRRGSRPRPHCPRTATGRGALTVRRKYLELPCTGHKKIVMPGPDPGIHGAGG